MRSKSSDHVLKSMYSSAFLTACAIEYAAIGSGLIDGLIIARMLGPESMAAEGIAHPFFSIVTIVSGSIMVGMQALCSKSLACGDTDESSRTFSLAVIASLIISTVLMLVLFFCSESVAMVLGAHGNSEALKGEAAEYIRGLSLGCVPMILCVVMSSAIQLDSGGSLVRISALAASVTDIVLDIIAVRRGYGLYGIGLATAASYVVNIGVLLIHFLRKNRMLYFTVRKLSWKQFPKLCLLGSERAGRSVAKTLRPIVVNSAMSIAAGTVGLSALSIHNSLDRFIQVPSGAMASAVAVLIGISYGEKNREEIRETGKLTHKYTFVYALIVAFILIIFAESITGYYTHGDTGELRELTLLSLTCLVLETLFSTLLGCRMAYLQTIRKIKYVHILIGLRLAVQAICVLVGARLAGARGIIISFAVYDGILLLVIYLTNAVKERKAMLSVKDYLSLPSEFDVSPDNRLKMEIHTLEEAVTVGEKIQKFCKERGYDAKTAFKAALCTEEIATNIIRHGFSRQKENSPFYVSVCAAKPELVITVKDRCRRFDLCERIRVVRQCPNPESNIGIKVIAKTADDIKYVNIVKTNVVIIKLIDQTPSPVGP